jgi:hypothetical protein
MFYDDHEPPHLHAEFGGRKALFDFQGNILRGSLESKTANRLIREWIDLHHDELRDDWELARTGKQVKSIQPLD